MKRLRCLLPLLACFLAGSAVAMAQGQSPGAAPKPPLPVSQENPISTERPGFTNGTDTVPLGTLQFEIGYAYSGSGGAHLSQIGNSAQLRVPVTDRFEVRFGIPSYQWAYQSGQSTQSGFADSSAGAKIRLLDGIQAHRPSLAFIGTTTLPSTGSTAFRDSHAQPSAALESHYDFSNLWNMEIDYVYTDARSGGQRFDQGAGGLCVSYNVSQALGTFLEAYRVSPTNIGGPTGDFVDGGITYAMGTDSQCDISVGKGTTAGVRSQFFIAAGYARRF